MKKIVLNVICVVLLLASIITLFVAKPWKNDDDIDTFSDGVERIDPNTIKLTKDKVTVDFSEVLLSPQKETRKLVVSEQEGKVAFKLSNNWLDFDIADLDLFKKTQNVSYTGNGAFVVDLDNMKKENIIDNPDKKILTIKIGHAHLDTIEIDPNNIILGDVKQGLLTRGDIKMSVQNYNNLEKEIRNKLSDKFNTASNGQEADAIALQMVKEIYEPIVKAIDPEYQIVVEFL